MQTRRISQAQVRTAASSYLSADSHVPDFVPDKVAVYHVLQASGASLAPPHETRPTTRLRRQALKPALHRAVYDFADMTYYAAHEASFGANFAAHGRTRLAAMLGQRPAGFVHDVNGHIVSALVILRDHRHPALQTPTLHVAFWAYDRERVTSAEATYIKNDWLAQLHREGSEKLSMQVASFNTSGLRIATRIGFERAAYRVEHAHA